MDVSSSDIVECYMGFFPEVRQEERPDGKMFWKGSLSLWEFQGKKKAHKHIMNQFCDKYGLEYGLAYNEAAAAASHVFRARSKPVELLQFFKDRAPRIIRAQKQEDLNTFETRGMIALFDRIDKVKSKCLQAMAYFVYGLLSLLTAFSLPILDSVIANVCKRRRETTIDRLSDEELDRRYLNINPSEKMRKLQEAMNRVSENIKQLEKNNSEKDGFFSDPFFTGLFDLNSDDR